MHISSKIFSCSFPNVSYSSKTDDGYLEYTAIRELSAGDQVTFSYIGDLFCTPTFERRSKLWDTKGFFCKCIRCMGPDHCRVHKCPNLECENNIYCFNSDSEDKWMCDKCGLLDTQQVQEIQNREKIILSKISQVQFVLDESPSGLMNVSPNVLQTLLKDAERLHLPTHYLNLKILKFSCTIYASHAAMVEQHMGLVPRHFQFPFGNASDLRLQAALTGAEFVSRSECVAEGCTGCKNGDGVFCHPPVYECASEVFHVYQDLKHVPNRKCPGHVMAMLKRYIRILYTCFGSNDSDVKEIEEALNDNSVQTAIDESASFQMPAGLSSKRGKKKKKRKGRTNKKKGRR